MVLLLEQQRQIKSTAPKIKHIRAATSGQGAQLSMDSCKMEKPDQACHRGFLQGQRETTHANALCTPGP
ncbi:C-Myc Promoter-Binding Protein [Manis pentadactyla]|nr:C-Myc Promoter-Binding Protein [Manis pentadactyla]